MSFNPDNKKPNKDRYDMTSKAQSGGATASKALFFSH